MVNYCPECGHELTEEVNFCPECGEELGNTDENQGWETPEDTGEWPYGASETRMKQGRKKFGYCPACGTDAMWLKEGLVRGTGKAECKVCDAKWRSRSEGFGSFGQYEYECVAGPDNLVGEVKVEDGWKHHGPNPGPVEQSAANGEKKKDRASELTNNSKGSVTAKNLVKTSGLVNTYLYDEPLLHYLETDEKVEFFFKHQNKGLKIIEAGGEESTPHHSNSEGARYLLVTDRALIYVAGQTDGDEYEKFDYNEIESISDHTGLTTAKIEFEDGSEATYLFSTNKNASELGDAVSYVQNQI